MSVILPNHFFEIEWQVEASLTSLYWQATESFRVVDFEMAYLETLAWKFNDHEIRLWGFGTLTHWNWEWNFFLIWWETGKIIRGNVCVYGTLDYPLTKKKECWKEPVPNFDSNSVFAACVIGRMYNFYLWQHSVQNKL